MDRQAQAGAHPQPHTRRRRRDRVVDMAAVAEGHVARGDAPRKHEVPRAVVAGPRPDALAQLARVDRGGLRDHVDGRVGDRRAVRGPQAPADDVGAIEGTHEQGPATAPAPVRAQLRQVAGAIAVGGAAEGGIGARADRPLGRDLSDDRAEDRRAVACSVLEQDPHGVLTLRELPRIDIEGAVVDAQGAGLRRRELGDVRIGSDIRDRRTGERPCHRFGAVDLQHRSVDAPARVGGVEAEMHARRSRCVRPRWVRSALRQARNRL